jgi:lipopolysaccharide/colanic/teichoic acid biosynthesis glycosyltransferase
VKRAFDLLVASLALAVLAPVMLLLAVAVRFDSPGPSLYRQRRVGRAGRAFTLLKFRSMRAGSHGPQVTAGGDARVTSLGGWLRRTKLDELPQLVNVVLGDMSLVGPRPEVPRYVELYPPDARDEVLSLRPGMTDDAAIRFRNEEQLLARAADPERAYVEEILPQKIEMYRQYVREHSFAGDLRILWRTMLALVR